jgi:hypothetical protein
MNKYESFMAAKEGPRMRVLSRLSHGDQCWCHISEMIARPEIFPLQPHGLDRQDRLARAQEQARQGNSWVITWGDRHGYSMRAQAAPPSEEYRHISKLWRDCK